MVYAAEDNRKKYLSQFCYQLSLEISGLLGCSFSIQTEELTPIGQDELSRKAELYDNSVFLLPIITPWFFKNKNCREALEYFKEKQKYLEIESSLIVPIYFLDCPEIKINRHEHENDHKDPLVNLIRSVWLYDWRSLRLKDLDDYEAKCKIAELAEKIRSRIQNIRDGFYRSVIKRYESQVRRELDFQYQINQNFELSAEAKARLERFADSEISTEKQEDIQIQIIGEKEGQRNSNLVELFSFANELLDQYLEFPLGVSFWNRFQEKIESLNLHERDDAIVARRREIERYENDRLDRAKSEYTDLYNGLVEQNFPLSRNQVNTLKKARERLRLSKKVADSIAASINSRYRLRSFLEGIYDKASSVSRWCVNSALLHKPYELAAIM